MYCVQGSSLGSQSHEIPGLGSIFQNFGIGIGIDFSKFWDWDWDRFFKSLGLRLGLVLQIQDRIPRNPKNPKKSQRSLKKFYFHELLIFFRIKVSDWKPPFQRPRSREFTNDFCEFWIEFIIKLIFLPHSLTAGVQLPVLWPISGLDLFIFWKSQK